MSISDCGVVEAGTVSAVRETAVTAVRSWCTILHENVSVMLSGESEYRQTVDT